MGHVRNVAPRFQARLKKLAEHPLVGETQGVGLIGGIEIVADKSDQDELRTRQSRSRRPSRSSSRRKGSSCAPMLGDRIAICPPLVIVEAEIDELFDRLEKGLAKGVEWARKEGVKLA